MPRTPFLKQFQAKKQEIVESYGNHTLNLAYATVRAGVQVGWKID